MALKVHESAEIRSNAEPSTLRNQESKQRMGRQELDEMLTTIMCCPQSHRLQAESEAAKADIKAAIQRIEWCGPSSAADGCPQLATMTSP